MFEAELEFNKNSTTIHYYALFDEFYFLNLAFFIHYYHRKDWNSSFFALKNAFALQRSGKIMLNYFYSVILVLTCKPQLNNLLKEYGSHYPMLNTYLPGTTVKFECQKGYYQDGSSDSTCVQGYWNYNWPECHGTFVRYYY